MTHSEITALDVLGAHPPRSTTCDCGADLHKAAEIAAGICVRCYRERLMEPPSAAALATVAIDDDTETEAE